MSLARTKGRELRERYNLPTPVDVEALAKHLGIKLVTRDLSEMDDALIRRRLGVARDQDQAHRRWAIAHGIGHFLLHKGDNVIWFRRHTQLGNLWERQAEEFARGLLVDWEEGENAHTIAWRCGVPVEVLL